MKPRNNLITVAVLALFALVGITACKKMIEIEPPVTKTTGANVYANDASAAAVLTGIYTSMSQDGFATGSNSISLLSGLSADEFKLSDAVSTSDKLYYYFANSLFTTPSESPGTENWSNFYNKIYTCNSAIEGIEMANMLSPDVGRQLLGEAKFIRAFLYFYLVNLYGSVPMPLTSDYETNSTLPRSSTEDVYSQIISDLIAAKDLLSGDFLNSDVKTSTFERVRPTKWAAISLLARAYLYSGDYVNAEIASSEIILNSSQFDLPPLSEVFQANSSEAIWQLQAVNSGWNTQGARLFVINSSPGGEKPISISPSLYSSFESGDNRKTSWIKDTTIDGSFLPFPFKYKNASYGDPVTEYLMVLRLGE